MKILILTGYYLPGFKAGGPIRSLSNLVERLGDSAEFYVVTRNRDLGATEPYPDISNDSWQQVGNARVKYVSDSLLSVGRVIKALRDVQPDIIYVNSFFDPKFGILPLLLSRLGLLKQGVTVVSSRGIFSSHAMALKSWKKSPFLFVARTLGLMKKVHWHATCEEEKQDVQRVMGEDTPVSIVSNLLPVDNNSPPVWPKKVPGKLNLIFLARIARIKNLHYAIKALRGLTSQTSLDVYGLNEDKSYWEECLQAIQLLPPNIQVNYRGELAPENVSAALSRYDALFLPTQSENFGYSIIESLTAGSPVIISDATPWRNLQDKNVGWDLSLQKPKEFTKALTSLAAMEQEEHLEMRTAARKMGVDYAAQETEVQKYLTFFESAAGTSRPLKAKPFRQAA